MDNAMLLKDYSPVPQALKGLCRKMQKQINKGELLLIDLLDDGSRDGEQPQIFKDNGETVTVQKYVGLFEYEGERVVIGSRFDSGGNAYFLRYLLEICWDAPLLLLDGLGIDYQKDPFDLLLVTKLALQLQRAWRKGALRLYRTFQHNDSRVRGALDVTRHIRENLGQDNGKIAYRTRSYSLDNDYNLLFLLACDAAQRKYPALLRRLCQRLPEFRDALQALKRELPDWPSVSRSAALQHTRKKIVNPIYRDYEAARLTARAILGRLGANPFRQEGCERQVNGVFLDMNELWERFLAKTLFRGAAGNFVQQTRGIMIPEVEETGRRKSEDVKKGAMVVRPDFLWENKGVVLDAKYRRVWADTLPLDGNWSEKLPPGDQKKIKENVYQVLAYMLTLGCTDGGVIFPVPGKRDCGECNPIKSRVGPAGQRFWRVPVHIPMVKDYQEFVKQMEIEVNNLRGSEIIKRVLT